MKKKPQQDCGDVNCPIHGKVRTRGRKFAGIVIASKSHKTATIEWGSIRRDQKYERFEKHRTKIKAHNPSCINAKDGDRVIVMECRPLSKTKKGVIIEKVGKDLAEAMKRIELRNTTIKKKPAVRINKFMDETFPMP